MAFPVPLQSKRDRWLQSMGVAQQGLGTLAGGLGALGQGLHQFTEEGKREAALKKAREEAERGLIGMGTDAAERALRMRDKPFVEGGLLLPFNTEGPPPAPVPQTPQVPGAGPAEMDFPGVALATKGPFAPPAEAIPGVGMVPTEAAHSWMKPDSEEAFKAWYAQQGGPLGLNPNPDDPQHRYDYRAAFRAGATPDESGHWPSQFKAPDHPNRFVDGMDTITGAPQVPGAGPQMPPLVPGVDIEAPDPFLGERRDLLTQQAMAYQGLNLPMASKIGDEIAGLSTRETPQDIAADEALLAEIDSTDPDALFRVLPAMKTRTGRRKILDLRTEALKTRGERDFKTKETEEERKFKTKFAFGSDEIPEGGELGARSKRGPFSDPKDNEDYHALLEAQSFDDLMRIAVERKANMKPVQQARLVLGSKLTQKTTEERLGLAREAASRGDYAQAEDLVTKILADLRRDQSMLVNPLTNRTLPGKEEELKAIEEEIRRVQGELRGLLPPGGGPESFRRPETPAPAPAATPPSPAAPAPAVPSAPQGGAGMDPLTDPELRRLKAAGDREAFDAYARKMGYIK